MSPRRGADGPSPYQRERAIALADAACVHDLDLTTDDGWVAAVEAYNAVQRQIGGWTVDLPARPLRALAIEARAAMCPHGLLPEHCAGPGPVHHDWAAHRP